MVRSATTMPHYPGTNLSVRWDFYCWDETLGPKQLGEESVYLVYTSISPFIIKRSRDRNSNRAGTWRPWRTAAYWFSLYGLLNLSYRTQDQQPRVGTTHNGLDPLHQPLIKENPYSQILWRHFLNGGSLLSENSS